MNPLIVVELGSIIFLILAGLTQVIIPLYKGVPLFPLFRSNRRRLRSELREEVQVGEEVELKREIAAVKVRNLEQGKPAPTAGKTGSGSKSRR